jgi:hypothetical protein
MCRHNLLRFDISVQTDTKQPHGAKILFCARFIYSRLQKNIMELPYRPSSTESVSLQEEREKPWKYIGYKVFTRWIASDPSFLILRQFGALNARVALSLQDEIVQLEEKLDYMDRLYSNRDAPDAHNGSFRDEPFTGDDDRQSLVRDVLPEKLARYSEFLRLLLNRKLADHIVDSFLNGYSQLVSRGACRPEDVASVRLWLRVIRPTAIDLRESEYIDRDGDLVQLHPQTRYLGRNILGSILFGNRWIPWGIPWAQKWFRGKVPEDTISLKIEDTVWPNDDRLRRLSTFFVTVGGLGMLIGPIWALAYLKPIAYRLALISIFMMLFFVVLSLSRSRLIESLAATAAYSAVLVVFLQAGVGSSS